MSARSLNESELDELEMVMSDVHVTAEVVVSKIDEIRSRSRPVGEFYWENLPGGVAMILRERMEQIRKGFNAAHDDAHVNGDIAEAAEQVLHHGINSEATYRRGIGKGPHLANDPNQWHLHIISKWQHNKVKMLTIAAALIVAEIERLERIKES